MLKKILIVILSLGIMVKTFAVMPGLPVECPATTEFSHSVRDGAGSFPWVLRSSSSKDWSFVENPSSSHLTEMSEETIVKVYITQSDSDMGITEVRCTYTLSDNSRLSVKTNKLNDYCPPQTGSILNPNFKDDPAITPGIVWGQYVTHNVTCDTRANSLAECNWDKEISNYKHGALHDCSGR